jgi:hypothetical protein
MWIGVNLYEFIWICLKQNDVIWMYVNLLEHLHDLIQFNFKLFDLIRIHTNSYEYILYA